MTGFKIVKVNSDYCDYLRSFDPKVPYNAGCKELKPFIGVLFTVEKCEYFAPLSSPKKKHKDLKNKLDLIKIDDGVLGVINLNNMIPVKKENYELFDLNKKTDDKKEQNRINLLSNQLRWLTANKKEILFKSYKLYSLYKLGTLPEYTMKRCCNFPLLEIKCDEYEQ